MRKIAIVGAGQVGLHLGIGLVRRGYDVRILTNRTAEQISTGRVLSSQAMLGPALDLERADGLELWESDAPPIEGIHFTWLDEDGAPVTRFSVRRARPALSVDQRVKMPRWMDLFEQSGGSLEVVDADAAAVEQLTETADLVIIAAGKGEISALFPADAARTEFSTPQRHLALAYVTGVDAPTSFDGNDFGKRDGVGEMFMFPALTTSGPCHIVTVEAVPDGPLDVFAPDQTAGDLVDQLRATADQLFPWLGERLVNARPTDTQSTLVGRFAPTRRCPAATLDNGATVLAAGDVVALNDPLTGQGANNAARCAALYVDRISRRGAAPFDPAWMRETGDQFASSIEASTRWTNATLRPWPDHVRRQLIAAATNPAQASRFAEGFGNPDAIWADWQRTATATRERCDADA